MCKKVTYHTLQAAEEAVRVAKEMRIKTSGRYNNHIRSAYQCKECGHFHTTSFKDAASWRNQKLREAGERKLSEKIDRIAAIAQNFILKKGWNRK